MPTLSRTPLGLKILIHTPARLAVSIAGIALAVVLMFTQDGFRQAMFDSQTETIRHMAGDLFIVSRLKYLMNVPEPFPSHRISQARGVAGVREALPLYLELGRSLLEEPRRTGGPADPRPGLRPGPSRLRLPHLLDTRRN